MTWNKKKILLEVHKYLVQVQEKSERENLVVCYSSQDWMWVRMENNMQCAISVESTISVILLRGLLVCYVIMTFVTLQIMWLLLALLHYKLDFVQWAYKKLYGEESEEFKEFKDTLVFLFDVYMERWSNLDDTLRSESCSQTEDEENDFDASYKNRSSSSMKTELDKYLDDERLDRRMELDVLSWWRMEQFRYPILFRLASDVLTILVSTVASESAFSIAGRVLDQYRSLLLPETVQALLCTRDWLFGKKDGDQVDADELTEDVLDLTMDQQSQTN
ncbi:zinc finger BED domain-containing protein DAYSLEEPER-like [Argentina anserina]|uniref:zinc finger BED domain-containing protein DAYSLEEPER-like n=1 Tax=Argentina anserina TaxID=57926 RepID=UPI0021762085|nr:zinc finger BED domain-containing protein DAYSLEEPER-like [Potentilla anserina]